RDALTSPRARARVSSFETICPLVARGMGVGVVPLYFKAAKEKSLGLRFVPLADDWAQPRSFVAVRDYDTLPVAAQAFVAHLRESAAGGGDETDFRVQEAREP
ncbi:MAG: hypothetical protein H7274_16130, partial [Rhodoferax sp.]|nr:hypothetical protein [Rhodoferax sp.]